MFEEMESKLRTGIFSIYSFSEKPLCQLVAWFDKLGLLHVQVFHYKMKQQSHFGKQHIRPGVKGGT